MSERAVKKHRRIASIVGVQPLSVRDANRGNINAHTRHRSELPAGHSLKTCISTVESTHVMNEIVNTEKSYLEELRSIEADIIRPYRIAKLKTTAFIASSNVAKVHDRKHSRSSSFFQRRPQRQPCIDLPNVKNVAHMECAFAAIELMIKAHNIMLHTFSNDMTKQLDALRIGIRGLSEIYKSFIAQLPYISEVLPAANAMLPNRFSGYSRFLSPMQRILKYRLMLQRLLNALRREHADDLLVSASLALNAADQLCHELDGARRAEDTRHRLHELSHQAGQALKAERILFDGPIEVHALSSRKTCPYSYAVLLDTSIILWSSDQKSWIAETVQQIEEAGHLDLVVHTTIKRGEKEKKIRRAVGIVEPRHPRKRTRKNLDQWLIFDRRRRFLPLSHHLIL